MTGRFDFSSPTIPFSTDLGLFFVRTFSSNISDSPELRDIERFWLFSLAFQVKKKREDNNKTIVHLT